MICVKIGIWQTLPQSSERLRVRPSFQPEQQLAYDACGAASGPCQRPCLREKKAEQALEMHPTLTEEESNVPLWPWEEEVISGAEYQRALEGLKRFVEEVEVNQLHTLEDLSAVASLVGYDVYVVAVTKGKKSEKKTEHFEPTVSETISRIEREYVFTHAMGNLEIVVTASKDHSLISQYRLVGFQRYRSEELSVRLPSDRDIAIGEQSNVDEQSMYAKDLRGARRAYYPATEPDSPEIQQVFAHLLKDALSTLRDVVSGLA